MYDIILFDLDDTLIDFQLSQKRSLRKLHHDYFPTVDYHRFEKHFKEINRDLWARVGAEENGLQPREVGQLRFSLLNEVLSHAHDTDHLVSSYESLLGETTEWLPGAQEVIELLHAEGKALGLITNGITQAQRAKIKRHALEQWFHVLLISDELGVSKPQRKIFDVAIEKMMRHVTHTATPKILMVGDSLPNDGVGAMNANIDFCLIGELKQRENEALPPIHFHLKSVRELPSVLNIKKFR